MIGARIGRFKVSTLFVHNGQAVGLNLFVGMAVLSIQRDWTNGHRDYVGVHPQFDEIELGVEPPEYVATFDESGLWPTWTMLA